METNRGGESGPGPEPSKGSMKGQQRLLKRAEFSPHRRRREQPWALSKPAEAAPSAHVIRQKGWNPCAPGVCDTWPNSERGSSERPDRPSRGSSSHLPPNLDGRGEFQQTDWGEHEKERVSASDGRGLLPALPPGDKAPVGTGRLQARFAGPEEAADRWRKPTADPLGPPQRRIKGVIGLYYERPGPRPENPRFPD